MIRRNKTPEDLGIDLADGKPQQLYRWFLACLLFARPIQQDIAANAYKLWGVIVVASILGIALFQAVALVERLVLRWQPELRRGSA